MIACSLVILVFCNVCFASDAEDFNPSDHIVARKDKYATHLSERCKCTCPPFDVPNVAKSSVAQVYVGKEEHLPNCSCKSVVLSAIPDLLPENYAVLEQHLCPTCKCTYQRRNLSVMFGVVVFVTVLVLLFASYALLYKVVWPKLIASLSYKEQRDDDIVLEDMNQEATTPSAATSAGGHARPFLRFPLINFITNQNSKWQRDLAEQQRNIYQDHTMLN